jgi:hypothetical protein
MFAACLEKAGAIFEAMRNRADEPYKRRPPISLRLVCSGDPAAKVVIVPGAHRDRTGILLDLDIQHFELLEERSVIYNGEDVLKRTKKLAVDNVSGRGPRNGSWIYKSALEDAQRLVATVREFLADPVAVFARSHDNCCICGRGLTDELSRSRGIGPECIKRLDMVVCRPLNKLVQAEPAPSVDD